MTRPFIALERFIERLFERPVNRLFHTRLQPIQVQRRLERTMETERRVGAARTYAPDRYRVQLHPDDLADFEGYRATLEAELAAGLLERAHARGYTLMGRPLVSLHGNAGVTRGEVAVVAEISEPAPGGLDESPGTPDWQAGDDWPGASGAARTAVFSVPAIVTPPIGLAVREPGGAVRRLAPPTGGLRIGRAPDNELVLSDSRVSRHHGRLAARRGTWVFTDLGSTNGSFLNGVRVTEIVLGPGDELRLGETVLTVEARG